MAWGHRLEERLQRNWAATLAEHCIANPENANSESAEPGHRPPPGFIAIDVFGMTRSAFGVTWDAFEVTWGAVGETWGGFGVTWGIFRVTWGAFG